MKEMEPLNLLTSLLALFNIGFFGNLVARLTGANVSILLFCGLLVMGATPVQVAGIMATYLVFIKLVVFTQGNRLSFKNFQIFRGWILWAAIAVSVAALFVYPFGADTVPDDFPSGIDRQTGRPCAGTASHSDEDTDYLYSYWLCTYDRRHCADNGYPAGGLYVCRYGSGSSYVPVLLVDW